MNKLSWPAVGLIAVLAATALGLASLAHWDPAAILGVLGILGGIGGGAAVTNAVAGRVDEVHRETQTQTQTLSDQTATLDTVARRVNGELDGRIAAAQEEAAEQGAARVIAVLREQGVIR